MKRILFYFLLVSAPLTADSLHAKTLSISEKKSAVLQYITHLSSDKFNGVIAGQNVYHGNEIVEGFATLITELHNQTGKWPGMLGVDYEFSKCFTPEELHAANKIIIDYWNHGGLITINLTPQNPWINDEQDIRKNPGTWNGPGHTQDKSKVTSLRDLLNPEKQVHKAWLRKLDRIADALRELQDAGVIVLWRPLQEMNGSWFWWGMASHPNDPAPYIEVYRHMHDYFEQQKGLHNLVWVYSPNSSMGQNNRSSWNRTVDWAYPGDDLVDIVAGTAYGDKLLIEDYQAYVALGKPLGMAEYGPDISGKKLSKNAKMDTRNYLERIKNDYPRIAYWVSWHWYEDANMGAIVKNTFFNELMNNPGVITRDNIRWQDMSQ
ncbi:mannan endo-1,4-beta-mannosidase [Alteromonadaceae bacterium 2753L.S.0a.02]|nr:mannan endo-1,4-beta-mannosidase [Alteromonadaceae bacterium 2753L.S.0a.02]